MDPRKKRAPFYPSHQPKPNSNLKPNTNTDSNPKTDPDPNPNTDPNPNPNPCHNRNPDPNPKPSRAFRSEPPKASAARSSLGACGTSVVRPSVLEAKRSSSSKACKNEMK